jgi:hypothetical protein
MAGAVTAVMTAIGDARAAVKARSAAKGKATANNAKPETLSTSERALYRQVKPIACQVIYEIPTRQTSAPNEAGAGTSGEITWSARYLSLLRPRSRRN